MLHLSCARDATTQSYKNFIYLEVQSCVLYFFNIYLLRAFVCVRSSAKKEEKTGCNMNMTIRSKFSDHLSHAGGFSHTENADSGADGRKDARGTYSQVFANVARSSCGIGVCYGPR